VVKIEDTHNLVFCRQGFSRWRRMEVGWEGLFSPGGKYISQFRC
jgi:hypothetical protein